MDGQFATILAYGQSGAGKTFTVEGPASSMAEFHGTTYNIQQSSEHAGVSV